MRRFLALLSIVVLLYSTTGCRHVGGACDCEHAINPSYGVGGVGSGAGCACGGVVAPAPVPLTPAAPAPSSAAGPFAK